MKDLSRIFARTLQDPLGLSEDLSLIFGESFEGSCKDLCQDSSRSIRNWCFDNQLLLNPDKTKLVIFGSRQMTAKVSDFRLFLLGKELEPVKAARDLGVTLDSNLTYNEHISFLLYPHACHDWAKLTALSIFLINEP